MLPGRSIHIVSVVGARPQFVKAGIFCRAVNDCADLQHTLVHTGQHYDDQMSGVFFRQLGLPTPTINLGVSGGSHASMIARMLVQLEQQLLALKPDAVVVFGDTNSTLAAAIAAAKLQLPLFHIEAGVRSGNRASPEEVNRTVTDHLSSYLLCPTPRAVHLATQEGCGDRAEWVGDIMLDAVRAYLRDLPSSEQLEQAVGPLPKSFALLTLHREEVLADKKGLVDRVGYVLAQNRAGNVVMPIHPRTYARFRELNINTGSIRLVPPVGYLEMQALLRRACLVFTDSGGLQKEAAFAGTPCVTLRTETEWVETIEAGWNRLWTEAEYTHPRRPLTEFGDGTTGQACVSAIRRILLS